MHERGFADRHTSFVVSLTQVLFRGFVDGGPKFVVSLTPQVNSWFR
jgi:hypothetical protein